MVVVVLLLLLRPVVLLLVVLLLGDRTIGGAADAQHGNTYTYNEIIAVLFSHH